MALYGSSLNLGLPIRRKMKNIFFIGIFATICLVVSSIGNNPPKIKSDVATVQDNPVEAIKVVKAEELAPVAPTPVQEVKPLTIEDYGKKKVTEKWNESQWDAFNTLVHKESGWRCDAQNPKSTAYGIGQFLDSTWGGTGIEKTSDCNKQVDAMLIYIEDRYGNPRIALDFHISHHWY